MTISPERRQLWKEAYATAIVSLGYTGPKVVALATAEGWLNAREHGLPIPMLHDRETITCTCLLLGLDLKASHVRAFLRGA